MNYHPDHVIDIIIELQPILFKLVSNTLSPRGPNAILVDSPRQLERWHSTCYTRTPNMRRLPALSTTTETGDRPIAADSTAALLSNFIKAVLWLATSSPFQHSAQTMGRFGMAARTSSTMPPGSNHDRILATRSTFRGSVTLHSHRNSNGVARKLLG